MDSNTLRNKAFELKKHVNAIHCTNNLTLVQRKLFNALLFNAYPDLPHKACFQIQMRQLCKLIGYNSNDYHKLKKALLGLITIAIEWNVIDCTTGKESKWKASAILASAQLADGLCVYEYSQIMKELLYRPEIYGRVNIHLMSKFKSSYGLALYENCIRYQGLPQTPWFTLDIFRKLMGVFGDKYDAFKDFKKRVLNIAVSEVNTISPLLVAPEIERANQQVIRIRFKLGQPLLVDNQKPISHSTDIELKTILATTFGFSEPLIMDTFAKYEQPYIQEKVNVILQSESFINGKIRGLAGYLIQALKQDFQAHKPSKNLVELQRREKVQRKKLQQEKDDDRYNNYIHYVNSKMNTYLSNLSHIEHQALVNEFVHHLENENSIIQGWYKQHQFEHPGVRGSFNNFIKNKKQKELGGILSYEEFAHVIKEYQ